MKVQQVFREKVQQYHLQQKRLLAAVSGGLDSVALAHLCKAENLDFAIAHCNFQLRGEESVRDEIFVTKLAKKLGVPLYLEQFDTEAFASEQKLSIQEAARNLRYGFFETLLHDHGYHHTLLAHHADDNVETLLMNFFRGTGLQGLCGIQEHQPEMAGALRPLLSLDRNDLEQYARENKMDWVEDSSNDSLKYTRNSFRKDLLPRLREIYPGVEENLKANIRRAQSVHNLYQPVVASLKAKIVVSKGREQRVAVQRMLGYRHTSLPFELIRDWGFSEAQLPELWKLCGAQSGRYIQSASHQLIKHGKWLVAAPLAQSAETVVIEEGDEIKVFAGGKLFLKKYDKDNWQVNKDASVAQLDASEVSFPLILRQRKAGDYFYPLGMRKKKKISRFLIDAKLSRNQKDEVWVVESHKKIIWIAGMRIDDRIKVTDSTKKILELTLTSL